MPDAYGNLIPGDPTPTACTRVGMIIPGLLKDDGGTIARSTAHPEFRGRVWTADFVLGDFRTALNEGGLDLCNEDEIIAGGPLRLKIKKLVPTVLPVTYFTDRSGQSSFPFSDVRIGPGCNVVGRIGINPEVPFVGHEPFCNVSAVGYQAWRVVKTVQSETGPYTPSIILSGSVVAATGLCTGLPASVSDDRVYATGGTFSRADVTYHLQLSPDGVTWNPITGLETVFTYPPRNCALGTGADPCPNHGPGSPWV